MVDKQTTRHTIRKTAVGVAGSATVLTELAFIPLPGPGTLVVLGDMSLLGREFPSARRAVARAKAAATCLTARYH